MTTKDIDNVYEEIRVKCLSLMQENSMPSSIMDFILSKVIAEIQTIHMADIIGENMIVGKDGDNE